ncbi:MAG TPA: DUF3237 domain-containing protein [Xanthobacteraceae bacterium]|nr:DUF3237 domain-containing protein [Xanthobacteraceae bacterium]
MGETLAVPALEYLVAINADVGKVVSLGPGPLGERRVVDILGGHFEGPRLRGKVLGGQDWQIARSDGVLDIDARYTIEADSGAKVRVVSQGYRHGPPGVMARLARGEDVDPADYFFRTVIRFETGDAGLAWLNKTLAVATAVRKARRVEIRAWRLL